MFGKLRCNLLCNYTRHALAPDLSGRRRILMFTQRTTSLLRHCVKLGVHAPFVGESSEKISEFRLLATAEEAKQQFL